MPSGFRIFIRNIRHRVLALYKGVRIAPSLLRDPYGTLDAMNLRVEKLKTSALDTEESLLYVTVGQALSAWAAMEETLVVVFRLLLRTSPEKAGLILFSIINFNVWLTIIHGLFELDDDFRPFQKRWNKISERIRAIKDKRDQLAHHGAGIDDGFIPSAVLRASPLDTRQKTKMQRPLDIQEVMSLAKTITAIAKDVVTLIEAMESTIEASKQKHA